MRKIKFCYALVLLVCAGFVSAQTTSGASHQTMTKEEMLMSPCFKLMSQEDFEKAEKEATTTIQLGQTSASGPVWYQRGGKRDWTDPNATIPISGISLRGAATYAVTNPGLLLHVKIKFENGESLDKYYQSTAPFNTLTQEHGPRDGCSVYFLPEPVRAIESIEVTFLTLPGRNGTRIKYVGKA